MSEILPPSLSLSNGSCLCSTHLPYSCAALGATSRPERCRVRWGAGLQGLPLPVTPAVPFKPCLPPLPETVIWWLITAWGLTLLADKQGKLESSTDSPFLLRRAGGELSLQRPHLFCNTCGFQSGSIWFQISILPFSSVRS